MRSARRIILLVLTTAVVGALLAWSLHGVDPDKVAAAFRNARLGYAPLALLMGMLVFPVKAVRWRVLLAPVKDLRMRPLLSAIMIGFMVNCIFSRVGEFARAAVLGIKRETRTSTALASIALERVFDMCTVLLFLVVSLLWLQPAASGEAAGALSALRVCGVVGALVLVGAVAFLALLRLKPAGTTRFVLWCVSWLPRGLRSHVQAFLDSFLAGLDTLQGVRQVAALGALSVVHWLCQVLFFFFAGCCFPDLGLSFPGAMLVFVISALGVAAAPVPGYVGIFQGGVQAATTIMGLPWDLSVSYAWLGWALNVPPIIIIGFAFLWAEGMTLRQLRAGKPTEA